MSLREIIKVWKYRDSPTWVSYSDGRTGEVGEYIVSRRQQALHGLLWRRRRRRGK